MASLVAASGNIAVQEFGALLDDLIDKRRKTPKGGEVGEVLASLIFGEVEGERLSPVELIQNCIFLLNAGHETTANLVGNGISILLLELSLSNRQKYHHRHSPENKSGGQVALHVAYYLN